MVNITRCDKREKNGKAFYIFHAVDDRGYAGSCVTSIAYGDKILSAKPEKLHLGRNLEKRQNFLYIK